VVKIPKELQILREKIADIQSGNYDVEADNPKVVKCWERLGCERRECPAYGKLRCWSIAGTFCRGKTQGEFAQKVGDCRKCVVYQESCGDEIGELIESFNLMAKEVKYNFLERERTAAQKSQSERLAELAEMAAVVAHETRNPLHSIGMAVACLKKHFHGEMANELMSIIEEEVNKLNNLTSLFLEFSQPAPLFIEPCNVNGIIQDIIISLQGSIFSQTVEVQSNLQPGLPEAVCDASRIKEAVINLLENSLEAIEGQGLIQITSALRDGHVVISVKDNGPGIAPEEIEKIFKPFHTTKTHGPGIGLSIVDRTIREHNGRIEVDNKPGSGAAFSLYLPTVPD
jgi:signal transduction histidine kinase